MNNKVESAIKKKRNIAALVTCHNRRNLTLAFLKNLSNQKLPVDVSLDIFLVDDASTDGTSQAVEREFPSVKLFAGDGNLFWGGGMRLAFDRASANSYDFYLWANDDISLDSSALQTMLEAYDSERASSTKPPIVVGVLRNPVDGSTAYGGYRSAGGIFPGKFVLLDADTLAQRCDTANGNLVLIPKSAAREIGNIDPRFAHRFGDFDYFLRAGKTGYPILAAAGTVGECQPNPMPMDVALDMPRRYEGWKYYTSLKGLEPTSWLAFSKRHGGLFWVFSFAKPYLKFWLRAITRAVRE